MDHGTPANVVALGCVRHGHVVADDPRPAAAFLVTVLGASALSVGVIEGIAEATNSLARVLSGTLSDWVGKRKPLVVLGYGVAAL